MGRADIKTREYMADPARFADAFNYAVYGGRQVVREGELLPMDSTAVAEPFGAKGATGVQRHRDGLRLWQAMRDSKAIYAVLGVENQTNTHYAMPVRNMLYDAMSYAGQVTESRRARGGQKSGARDRGEQAGSSGQEGSDGNEGSDGQARGRSAHNKRGNPGAEYLSGLGKEDKLLPVATLVIHFGTSEWDGPLSLHEMLAEHDEELLALVPDYRINLIEPSRMADEDFDRFRTELGLVLGYIKHAEDKEALSRFVEENERFKNVGMQSADLINVVTDSELELEPGEERINMCKAIKDMREESERIGEERERRRMSKAIKDMREESERIGEERGALSVLAGLVKDGILSLEDASARVGMDAQYFQAEMARLA